MLRKLVGSVAMLLLVTVVGAIAGCGPAELPYTDNSKDSLSFAKDMKQMVLNTIEQVRNSPQPADSIRVIVQSLSELDACPTGDHLKTFEELHKMSSDLLSQCENGKPSDFQSKINAIAEVAKTLPGEVSIDKNARSDK